MDSKFDMLDSVIRKCLELRSFCMYDRYIQWCLAKGVDSIHLDAEWEDRVRRFAMDAQIPLTIAVNAKALSLEMDNVSEFIRDAGVHEGIQMAEYMEYLTKIAEENTNFTQKHSTQELECDPIHVAIGDFMVSEYVYNNLGMLAASTENLMAAVEGRMDELDKQVRESMEFVSDRLEEENPEIFSDEDDDGFKCCGDCDDCDFVKECEEMLAGEDDEEDTFECDGDCEVCDQFDDCDESVFADDDDDDEDEEDARPNNANFQIHIPVWFLKEIGLYNQEERDAFLEQMLDRFEAVAKEMITAKAGREMWNEDGEPLTEDPFAGK